MSHGADIDNIKRQFKIEGDIIDFSSNINPNLPDLLKESIFNNIDSIRVYPDVEYVDLRKEIAYMVNKVYIDSQEQTGINRHIDTENICVGNGASELISLLFRLDIFEKVRVLAPLYSEYIRSSKIAGKVLDISYMKTVNKDYLSYDEMDIDLGDGDLKEAIVVCNPGSPDGRLRKLDFLVDYCKKRDKYLIVDESFMDFCQDYKLYTAFNYDYDKLIVIKSMTKIYGIPGLRMGYLMARDESVIRKIRSIQEPWSVNSLAELGTRAVLKDLDFLEKTRESYRCERKYLMENLLLIDYLDIVLSESAYILCSLNQKSKYRNAHQLKIEMVKKNKILIRDASSFEGLGEKHFRLAVKSRENNEKLIEALKSLGK